MNSCLHALFVWVARASWEASLVAALVLAAQWAIKGHVSARWRYNLWLLVVIRLMLPVMPAAKWSPFNWFAVRTDASQAAVGSTTPISPDTPAPLGQSASPAPAQPAARDLPQPIRAVRRSAQPLPMASPPREPRTSIARLDDAPASVPMAAPVDPKVIVADRAQSPVIGDADEESNSPLSAIASPGEPATQGIDQAVPFANGPGDVFPTDTLSIRAPRADLDVQAGAHLSDASGAFSEVRTEDRATALPPLDLTAQHRQINEARAGASVAGSQPFGRSLKERIGRKIAQGYAHWTSIAALAWAVGALLLLARAVGACARISWMVRRLPAIDDPQLSELLESCRRQAGLRKAPRLLAAPPGTGPALLGALAPRLLVPPGLTQTLNRNELRLVLLHELAHLKRGDVALNWLLAVLQAAHWFNPVFWLTFARLRADRELACDEYVLSTSQPARRADDRRDYGRAILKLLVSLPAGSVPAGAVGVLDVGGWFHKAQLRRRITMIALFDGSGRRTSAAAIALSLAVGAVALTGAVRGQEKPPAQDAVGAQAPAQPAPTVAAEAPAQPNPTTAAESPGDKPAAPAAGASAARPEAGDAAPAREEAGATNVPSASNDAAQSTAPIPTAPVAGVPAAEAPGTPSAPSAGSPDPRAGAPSAVPDPVVPGSSAPATEPRPGSATPPIAIPTPASAPAAAPPSALAPTPAFDPGAAPATALPPAPASAPGAPPSSVNFRGSVNLHTPGGVTEIRATTGNPPGIAITRTETRGLTPVPTLAPPAPAGRTTTPFAGSAAPGMGRGPAMSGHVEDAAAALADDKTAQALLKPIRADFQDVSLTDAMNYLSDQTGVDVFIDRRSLDETPQASPDSPLTLHLREPRPAESLLPLILRAANGGAMGYEISNGVLIITSRTSLERTLVTRAYRLQNAQGQWDDLSQLIQDTVAPGSWSAQGGPGGIHSFGNKLIITATVPNQREVAKLLGLLEQNRVSGQGGPGSPMSDAQAAHFDPTARNLLDIAMAAEERQRELEVRYGPKNPEASAAVLEAKMRREVFEKYKNQLSQMFAQRRRMDARSTGEATPMSDEQAAQIDPAAREMVLNFRQHEGDLTDAQLKYGYGNPAAKAAAARAQQQRKTHDKYKADLAKELAKRRLATRCGDNTARDRAQQLDRAQSERQPQGGSPSPEAAVRP